MNRRVSQNIDYLNFNSAELSVKLCETLRDILFFYFLVTPRTTETNKNPEGGELNITRILTVSKKQSGTSKMI